MVSKSRKKTRKQRQRKSKKSSETMRKSKIRVVGIGGGGGSIVSEIAPQLKRIDFVVANTDLQALKVINKKARVFPFGQSLTRGLGCGMDPKLGEKAAKTEREKIAKIFKGVDLAILVSCLGGGTGSGAAPEFAKIAKELGVITLGIFTLPFKFEGFKRIQIAKNSLEKLAPHLNTLAVIPNENIFQIIDKNTPFGEAFAAVNGQLAENLKGLIEMIYVPGLINIDFADLKTILGGKGKLAYLNVGWGQGDGRAEKVTKAVLTSPLYEYNILGADKVLFNITASQGLGMKEVEEASRAIFDYNHRARIILGVSHDNNYQDRMRICLLAVGCGEKPKPKPKSKPKPKPLAQPPIEPQIVEPKPKPKTRPKPKPKSKTAKMVQQKISIKVEESKKETPPEPRQSITRKNALDIQKEAESTEQDLLAQEEKWGIPAFLRRKADI